MIFILFLSFAILFSAFCVLCSVYCLLPLYSVSVFAVLSSLVFSLWSVFYIMCTILSLYSVANNFSQNTCVLCIMYEKEVESGN